MIKTLTTKTTTGALLFVVALWGSYLGLVPVETATELGGASLPPTVTLQMAILGTIAAGIVYALRDAIRKVTAAGAPAVTVTRSNQQRGRVRPRVLVAVCFAGLILGALSACGPDLAGEQAAREVNRHRLYLTWFSQGFAPIGDGATRTLTVGDTVKVIGASGKAWEAQAYWHGTGPMPSWLEE